MSRLTACQIAWIPALALLGLTLSSAALAEDAAAAEAAFEKFAKSWVADLQRQAANERSGAIRYTAYDPAAVATQLQATGKDAAPFVGTLTYTQVVYQCQTSEQKNCQKVESSPVTEIFPFQDGRWRY